MKKPLPLPPSHTFSTQQQRTCWSSSPGENTGRERACTLCTRPKTWQRGARRGTLRAHQWPGSSIAKGESRSREKCLGTIGQHALTADDIRATSLTSTQVGCLFLYRGGCMEKPRHPDSKLASLPVGAKNVCLTIENAMPNVTRLADSIPDAAELPACLPASASGATQAATCRHPRGVILPSEISAARHGYTVCCLRNCTTLSDPRPIISIFFH